jgi:hypothetical protein
MLMRAQFHEAIVGRAHFMTPISTGPSSTTPCS